MKKRNMKKEDIEKFFKDRPALSKSSLCKEAKISKGLLDMIIKGERTLTQDTIDKLLPVLKKYGY